LPQVKLLAAFSPRAGRVDSARVISAGNGGDAVVISTEEGEIGILSHGHHAMSVFDPDSRRILQVNEAWVALYGWTREEATQMHVTDVSAEPSATHEAIERAKKSGGERLELRWQKRKDGSRFPTEMMTGSLRVRDRTVMYAVICDVTERRYADDALRRSEEGFRALIESLPDGVIVHRGGVIIYLNPWACDALGFASPVEAIGKPLMEIVHPDERRAVAERIRDLLAAGAPAPLREVRLLRKDGTHLSFEVAAIPTLFDGQPAVLSIGRDLSARKQMEAQLLMADRLASLGRLAASVGHEINNPLAYVLGNVHLMKKELAKLSETISPAVQESLAERLAIIEEGATRVRDIVRDLKTLSLGERDGRGPSELHHVLEVSANMAEHELRHRARLVRGKCEHVLVAGTEARLGQVFLNLLVNAAHAIPEGNVDDNEVRIAVRKLDEARITIEVSDTGVGIPPGVRDRIFEPFFTTKTRGTGTGLGLSICHHIVTTLGGTIDVQPNRPRGSLFRVTLPIVLSGELVKTPQPFEVTIPATRRPAVLVVDDEHAIARTLAAELGEMDVTINHSGRQAIATLERNPAFDVIVLDLLMDDLTGVDVFDYVRERQPGLERRVIFMTGGAFTTRAQMLVASAKNQCLDKPFAAAALRTAIHAVLSLPRE
jgi:PAS domain S-box-containing protein